MIRLKRAGYDNLKNGDFFPSWKSWGSTIFMTHVGTVSLLKLLF